MSTSPTTHLSEPVGADKISQGTLGYICMRNRQRQYDLVIREFKKSGISQKELADRLGSTPDVISRLLARPGNWESDTFAKLMFGISGAVPAYQATYPLRAKATPNFSAVQLTSSSNEIKAARIIGPETSGGAAISYQAAA